MSHRETKKETKMQNKKNSRPETIHDDEMKKQPFSGAGEGKRN